MSLLSSRRLANLTASFHSLQVTYVAIRSGLLDSVSEGKISEYRLLRKNNPSVEAIIDSMIEAGVSCGLITKNQSELTGFGREFTRTDPNGFRAWVVGLVELQGKMLSIFPGLLSDTTVRSSPYSFENTAREEVGIAEAAEGMARFVGFRCLRKIPQLRMEQCKILDIGCGNGEYLVHLASRNPTLTGVGIEKSPTLAKLANERVTQFLKQENILLQRRIQVLEGDFFEGKMNGLEKQSFDACLLNFILHYFSREQRRRLFSKCASLLEKEGILVILEPVLNDLGAKQRIEFAAFNLNLYPQNTDTVKIRLMGRIRMSREVGCGYTNMRTGGGTCLFAR